jgi:hypothetical protein
MARRSFRIDRVTIKPSQFFDGKFDVRVTTTDGHIYSATWANETDECQVSRAFRDDARDRLIDRNWTQL